MKKFIEIYGREEVTFISWDLIKTIEIYVENDLEFDKVTYVVIHYDNDKCDIGFVPKYEYRNTYEFISNPNKRNRLRIFTREMLAIELTGNAVMKSLEGEEDDSD